MEYCQFLSINKSTPGSLRYLLFCAAFVGIIAILGISCESSNVKTSPISQTSYEVYSDVPGPIAQVGQYVFFEMDIFDDKDSLLQSNRNQRQMPSVKIAPEDSDTRANNPLIDVISTLSLGDSVGIILPKEKIPSLPPQFDYIEHLIYKVAVKEILTEEALMARRQEEQAAFAARAEETKKRLPEIEAITKDVLEKYKNGEIETQKAPMGTEYYIHKTSDKPTPKNEQMVTVMYYGTLMNGSVFDNSFDKGRGYTFRLGRDAVINGWHDAIQFIPIGGSASIFIPSELGYGENGFGNAIPPNSQLHFYIEVEEVLN